jgi:hypothetical protein
VIRKALKPFDGPVSRKSEEILSVESNKFQMLMIPTRNENRE